MKDSKSETKSNNIQLPNAPEYIKEGLQGLTGAIVNLGNRNPSDFVPGASSNQTAAFDMAGNIASRYGSTPVPQFAQPSPSAINVDRGPSLFAGLDVQSPDVTQYDYSAVFNDRPDLQTAYSGLSNQERSNIAQVLGIPAGNINAEQFAQFAIENNPISPEYRQHIKELSGGGSKTGNPLETRPGPTGVAPVDMGGGRFGSAPDGGSQLVAPGPTSSGPSYNPLDLYGDATSIARQVSTAGANTYDPSMIDAGGIYEMLMNEEFAPRVTAGRVSAQSLLDNLDAYMSPYINDVVDTTLAEYDENAARTRAAQSAQAAANGAFGGSRYGILEAITEGEIGRTRASTEANLRDQAFQVGAGLSADDANRRQSASATNAELAQQASLANAQNDLTRLLRTGELMFQGAALDQDASNTAGRFNASQVDTALDRALRGADSLRTTASTFQGNERADTALVAELGAQERAIQQQEANAELGLLSEMVRMAQALGINTSQVTGVTSSGTQTTSSTPGLLDWVNAGTGLIGAINAS